MAFTITKERYFPKEIEKALNASFEFGLSADSASHEELVVAIRILKEWWDDKKQRLDP